MNLKAIYFDLDDTLCGYWDASKAAMRTTFNLYPIEGKTTDEMILHWASAFRKFSGTLKETGLYETYCKTGEPTRTEQMRLTLIEAGAADEAHANQLSESYAFHRDKNLKLFEDAIEVLDFLFGRYPLGLITNGPADIQRQEIATLGIGKYFKKIYIEGEMGVGKPHQTVFDRAAKAVEAQPDQLLFVGNSYAHDIAPAIEAGWHTAWVRRASDVAPSKSAPDAKPQGAADPTFVIGELRELLGILGQS